MKLIQKFSLLALVLVIAIAACASPPVEDPTPDPQMINTIVAATMAAMTPLASPTASFTATPAPTSTPEPSPTPSQATVTGKVCYPNSATTEMQAYFQNRDGGLVVELPLVGRQDSYRIELAPGKYIAYAWLKDFSLGGLYSQAVACGLRPGCSDHSALEFTVAAGQTFAGIDLCDWNHGPFDVPYPPGKQATETVGTIAGSITNYPGSSLPTLTVVAFSQTTPYWYWVGTAAGVSFFSISNLPPGEYRVVAYDGSGKAGGSPQNTLVQVGQTVNVTISDWSGSYPPNPVK